MSNRLTKKKYIYIFIVTNAILTMKGFFSIFIQQTGGPAKRIGNDVIFAAKRIENDVIFCAPFQ